MSRAFGQLAREARYFETLRNLSDARMDANRRPDETALFAKPMWRTSVGRWRTWPRSATRTRSSSTTRMCTPLSHVALDVRDLGLEPLVVAQEREQDPALDVNSGRR